MNLLYNVSFDIAAIIITVLTVIILLTQYTNNTRANKMYRVFTFVLLTAEILDFVTAITISYASVVPIWLNLLLNSLFFLANLYK